MVDFGSGTDEKKLRELVIKSALNSLDWDALRAHFDDVGLSRYKINEVCGHIRRCTDLICKYPRSEFKSRRTRFFDSLQSYAEALFGAEAVNEICDEVALIERIERGYRGILNVLNECDISKRSAEVRVGGNVSLACHVYKDLILRRDETLANKQELNLLSGIRLQDGHGNTISADSVLEGLSGSLAVTLIMEAHKNNWFDGEIIVLPKLLKVGEKVRLQSGSTQVLALFWRHWQRVEKRHRYLGGELRVTSGDERPEGLPDSIEVLIEYIPPQNGLLERDAYDYLANTRLQDRLVQTFMEMEIEGGLSGKGVGIGAGAALPPLQFVSGAEAHAGVSLSEILGYSIADDNERPGGLRLLEWVRGYSVLKEIAQSRTADENVSGDGYAIRLTENELLNTLQACGLERDLASVFIARTCLHKSSRDMFDCPLVRVGSSNYFLFAPSVIDLNIPMAVLSNLSNRGEILSRKGEAFEEAVRAFFRDRELDVFAFSARRDGQEFEFDAILAWEEYLFVFECKNRSLSGNDPMQAYYFDLEVASQAKQVRRLVDALANYPDIIEEKMGTQYVGMKVVPCVLHSLPYSRIGDIDGIYFTDASALYRFFNQKYFWIMMPHRIGAATLLHRTAIKKLWKGDKPTAVDLLVQLEQPFQLELSLQHLELSPLQFGLSRSEVVLTHEIIRTEMSTRSVCDVVGVDADEILKEVAFVSENAAIVRAELERPNE